MNAATIGIDFGTTTSSMAWVDPGTGKAEVLMNAEGELKTPSVVYFGAEETLVGTPAEQLLEDEEERRRVVMSVKRELVNAPTLALPGRRVKAVEVAAAVLAKLKRDAEELHFHSPVTRAVVTCPAAFYAMERDEIARAALQAGFAEVELLDEPVAAALAYSRAGLEVGHHLLVYDLGGGTFDLALLRAVDGGFELAMAPKGLRRCGGDDFDEALYDWCDEEALRQWGEPLDATGRDLRFLRECRKRKETLSARDKVLFSSLVGSGRVFKHSLTRAVFEALIRERVEQTVRLTGELVRAAAAQGSAVETAVLIGGASRVPLIQSELATALPVAPRRWQHQDVAVALGAAYRADARWRSHPGLIPAPTPAPIVTLAPNGSGDYASFEQAVAALPADAVIRLLPGEYRLKAPLSLDKPLRLIGAGMDDTAIVGYWEDHVLAYGAKGRFAAEGISFRHAGTTLANVVMVTSGEVAFKECRFSGGSSERRIESDSADDVSADGEGLVLRGPVTGRVIRCRIEHNAGRGLVVCDGPEVELEGNRCEANAAAQHAVLFAAPQDLHGQPADLVQRLQRETAEALGLEVTFRHRLRDGGEGPELLVIPPGRFRMGSPASEAGRSANEGPQHAVTIVQPFAIGRFAVTFAEYDAFCAATGRDRPDDEGWGRDRRPVINVSWHGAMAYCDWLSVQTGRVYRLPSEAEWEYAARAGTTSAFWWGDQIDSSLANYNGHSTYADGSKGEYRQRTLPVGSFQPNPFGLYQVHGNVWEWCLDSWHDGYSGAPTDGSAWETGGQASRVRRGGSWYYGPWLCRAAYRGHSARRRPGRLDGFRLCCGSPIE